MDAVKAKALGKGYHFYVFSVATLEEHREKGLAVALMRKVQSVAQVAGKPVWLEATTERSYWLYLSLGWEVTKEAILGKGTIDAEGFKKSGGEGVKIWGMLRRPKS